MEEVHKLNNSSGTCFASSVKTVVHIATCCQTSHVFSKQLQLFLENDVHVSRYKHLALQRAQGVFFLGTELHCSSVSAVCVRFMNAELVWRRSVF